MKDGLFGDLIFSYTRKQAIEDGVLVDLTSKFPKDTRLFKYPVACTSAIWSIVPMPVRKPVKIWEPMFGICAGWQSILEWRNLVTLPFFSNAVFPLVSRNIS